MFESLTEKLTQVFRKLGGKGRLSEEDVREGLREIRRALLSADVYFPVVRELTERIRGRAVGEEVLSALTPAQQLLKIVRDELAELMGGEAVSLKLKGQPALVMLVGPKGGGKTTTAGKLALHLRKRGRHPLLFCADPFRPAAAEQLGTLAEKIEIPFRGGGSNPVEELRAAVRESPKVPADTIVIDTPGLLPGQGEALDFLRELAGIFSPGDVLLVLDALVGQEAVEIAKTFLPLGTTGVVLTKLDGDARGGAALSVRYATELPVLFIGVGEHPPDLEVFHPTRMADRILGLGDVAGLFEKVEEVAGKELEEISQKVRTGEFTLQDYLEELEALRRAGPISQLLSRIPGFGRIADDPELERELVKVRAIIQSMTPEERLNPHIIGASRKRRIARGSGTTVQDVNRLLSQFEKMRKLMKQLGKKRKLPPGWEQLLRENPPGL